MHRRGFLKSGAVFGAAMSRWDSGKAVAAGPESAGSMLRKAEFIEPPRLIVPHRPDDEFLGRSVIRLRSARLLMAASGYEAGAGSRQGPRAWISSDRGHTWKAFDRLKVRWTVSGQRLGGSVSFLRLRDDGGKSWSQSTTRVTLPGSRGMAETPAQT